MSKAARSTLLLFGATGLVGSAVIAATPRHPEVDVAALARREAVIPSGAQLEMLIADPADWPSAIARVRPDIVVIALGTTLAAQSGDRSAFRAVDRDLIEHVARAARVAGTRQLILISSAGADAGSRNFYLSVKGETEVMVNTLNFERLDIVRPGLLRGPRKGPLRRAERFGQLVSPFIDVLLHGRWAAYRSVHAHDVAAAIYALAGQPGRGRRVHDSADIRKLARSKG